MFFDFPNEPIYIVEYILCEITEDMRGLIYA